MASHIGSLESKDTITIGSITPAHPLQQEKKKDITKGPAESFLKEMSDGASLGVTHSTDGLLAETRQAGCKENRENDNSKTEIVGDNALESKTATNDIDKVCAPKKAVVSVHGQSWSEPHDDDSSPRNGTTQEFIKLQRQASKARAKTRKLKLATFGRRYHTITYGVYFASVVILLLIEGLFQFLAHGCSHPPNVAPTVRMLMAAEDLRLQEIALKTATEQRPVNGTLVMLSARALQLSAANFNKVFSTSMPEANRIYRYDVAYFGVFIGTHVIIACLFYKYRNNKTVKSRGRSYLVHFLGSVLLLMAFFPVVSAAYYFQMITFPDATDLRNAAELKRIRMSTLDAAFWCTVIGYYLISSCLSAIVMRQRMIYLIFSNDMKLSKSLNYFKPFPFLQIIPTVALISLAWWRYAKDMHPHYSVISHIGLMELVLMFSAVFIYYSYNTRSAYLQFSDYHSNIRLLITFDLLVACLYLVDFTHPESLFAYIAGWSSLVRMVVNVSVIDLVACLVTQEMMQSEMPTLTQRSVSAAANVNE